MPTRTTTQVTHYDVQKNRRAKFIEDWRENHRTVIRKSGEVPLTGTDRGMRTGVYMGEDGDNPTRTMDALVHEVDPGVTTTVHRHSWDVMVFVVAGWGWTEIDGERIDWGPGDSLHLPSWAWHRSGNEGTETARYLTFSSEPMLATMGLSVLEDAGHIPSPTSHHVRRTPGTSGATTPTPAASGGSAGSSRPVEAVDCTRAGTSWRCSTPRAAPVRRSCSTGQSATRPPASPWRCSRSARGAASRCTGIPARPGSTSWRARDTPTSGTEPEGGENHSLEEGRPDRRRPLPVAPALQRLGGEHRQGRADPHVRQSARDHAGA